MDTDAFLVDFDAYSRQRAALARHLDASQTEHENACRALEQLVQGHMTSLPSAHQPLLELVGWMRERHAETQHFFSDTWLHDIDQFVGVADTIHAEAITTFSEEKLR